MTMRRRNIIYQITSIGACFVFLKLSFGEWISSTVNYDLVRNISRELQWTKGIGYGLNDQSVLTTYVDLPILECIWQCIARPRCVGLEYRTKQKYCRLVSNYTTQERQPGSVAVTGFNNLTDRPCGNQTCSINETCEYSPLTGQLTCQITDCGYPTIDEYIFGNQYVVGSRLFHHHGTKLRQMTCASDGQWEYGQVVNYPGLTCGDIRWYRHDVTSGVFTNSLGLDIYCEFDEEESWLTYYYEANKKALETFPERKENNAGFPKVICRPKCMIWNDWRVWSFLKVFQRRQDGSVNFTRNREDYKNGFGSPTGELWLGLEHIYTIQQLAGNNFSLQIDMETWDGTRKTATYSYFSIGDENDKFRLNISGFTGTDNLNDALSVHDGMMFTTYDHDNDESSTVNCARVYLGGWWFRACVDGYLNGKYYRQGDIIDPSGSGIIWKPWINGVTTSLKSTVMKMKNNWITKP